MKRNGRGSDPSMNRAAVLAFTLCVALLVTPINGRGESSQQASDPKLPPSFYLVTAEGYAPLPEEKIVTRIKGNVTYYHVPLERVPEARSPLEVLDTYPSDGPTFYVLIIGEDGLIFSWGKETNYFVDEIQFYPFFDSIDEKNIMTWNQIPPGLYAFVENTTMGIGEICYPFRIVP